MIDRSLALDPFNPLFLVIGALIYAWAGRYDEVHRLHKLGEDLNPGNPATAPVDAITKELEGRQDEAVADFAKLASQRAELMGFYGSALARAGRHDEARTCIDHLLALPLPAPLDVARIHVGLRDADEALRWLGIAVAQRTVHLILMPADPRFDWLRADPRFAEVTRPMSLP